MRASGRLVRMTTFNDFQREAGEMCLTDDLIDWRGFTFCSVSYSILVRVSLGLLATGF